MERLMGRAIKPLNPVKLFLLTAVLLVSISSAHAFELNGFADVSFTKGTEGAEEFRNGDFAFGTLDLYLAETLDDIEILTELIVEMGNVLDLERLTLGYTFNDTLRVRAGRFHTPLGFWNTAYHHGVQLQPTILRPEFLNFEDDAGILPVHTIGIYLSGRVRTGIGKLEYGAMVGNGPTVTVEDGANVLDPNNISDNSIGKAIALHATIAPTMVEGLKVGISGHMARVQDDGTVTSAVDVDQTILGAAVTYSIGPVGIAGEYFSIKDEDNTTDSSDSNNAYYGLITYTYKDRWIPYLMYENMAAEEDDDPYFISLGVQDLTKTTFGLRYNINYRSSIKGEFRSVEKGDEDWNEYAVQWALAF